MAHVASIGGSSSRQFKVAGRKRRKEALSYARASVALEGFDVPDEYETEAQKFVRGEIDFDALTVKVHEIGQGRYMKQPKEGERKKARTSHGNRA